MNPSFGTYVGASSPSTTVFALIHGPGHGLQWRELPWCNCPSSPQSPIVNLNLCPFVYPTSTLAPHAPMSHFPRFLSPVSSPAPATTRMLTETLLQATHAVAPTGPPAPQEQEQGLKMKPDLVFRARSLVIFPGALRAVSPGPPGVFHHGGVSVSPFSTSPRSSCFSTYGTIPSTGPANIGRFSPMALLPVEPSSPDPLPVSASLRHTFSAQWSLFPLVQDPLLLLPDSPVGLPAPPYPPVAISSPSGLALHEWDPVVVRPEPPHTRRPLLVSRLWQYPCGGINRVYPPIGSWKCAPGWRLC